MDIPVEEVDLALAFHYVVCRTAQSQPQEERCQETPPNVEMRLKKVFKSKLNYMMIGCVSLLF